MPHYVKRRKDAEDAAMVQHEYAVLRHLDFVGVDGVVRALAFDPPTGALTLEHAGDDLLELYEKRWGGVDDTLRVSLCEQLLSAVRALHDMQAVHLDLKMENVCVDRFGKVRLIDFETCKLRVPRDCGAVYTDRVGTEAYACPEIASMKPFCPYAADAWSFGIVVFAVWNNSLPFVEASATSCRRYCLYCLALEREGTSASDALRSVFDGHVTLPPVAAGMIDPSLRVRWEERSLPTV